MTNSLFDKALSTADAAILDTMAVEVAIVTVSGERVIKAVFDDPEIVEYVGDGRVKVYSSHPALFVKVADVVGVRRQDVIRIGETDYAVERIGRAEGDMCTVYLALIRDRPSNKTKHRGSHGDTEGHGEVRSRLTGSK